MLYTWLVDTSFQNKFCFEGLNTDAMDLPLVTKHGSTVREFAGFLRLTLYGSLLCSHGCLTRELSVFASLYGSLPVSHGCRGAGACCVRAGV